MNNPKQQIKNRVYTRRKIVNNLLRYYHIATPEEISRGSIWYEEAYQFCKELSERHGVEIHRVAGITAAFSPQTTWDQNKVFSREFLHNRGRAFIHNRDRTLKAKRIYKEGEPSTISDMLSNRHNGALKTRSFYRNIILPGYCDTVTIDRHALAICIQRPDRTRALDNNEAKITPVQYQFISECYVDAAKRIGIIPSQLQAILWIVYRRIRGIEKPPVIDGYTPMDIENF